MFYPIRNGILYILLFLVYINPVFSMNLPKPDKTGGKPLMQALSERKTNRDFQDKALSEQMLSNLLWAAFGVNRDDSGKRTAPSARNWQEIDIYAAMEDGLYLYDAESHSLRKIHSEDIRNKTGLQGFTKDAPVCLVFVADYKKMGSIPQKNKDFYSAINTGYISQNVYLFCASEGLSTVALGMVNKDGLAKKMQLEGHQNIIITQPVAFPGS